VLGGKGGLGEIRCPSKSKQLAIAELAPNKVNFCPMTSPTVLSLFYLNLKKDKKLHIKSLPQVRFTKRWELIGRAVFEWVREVNRLFFPALV